MPRKTNQGGENQVLRKFVKLGELVQQANLTANDRIFTAENPEKSHGLDVIIEHVIVEPTVASNTSSGGITGGVGSTAAAAQNATTLFSNYTWANATLPGIHSLADGASNRGGGIRWEDDHFLAIKVVGNANEPFDGEGSVYVQYYIVE
jgi:hypothetical protein